MEPGVESDYIKHHLRCNVTFYQFLLLSFRWVSPCYYCPQVLLFIFVRLGLPIMAELFSTI